MNPNQYRIYGIFDFVEEKLIYVNMSLEETDLEFDMTGYDVERYDVVEFDVVLI
jgi:hypothetical protein